MTRIHVSRNKSRVERKDGDQKMIKGVLHERISTRTVLKCESGYVIAYDCTSGRQRHEWVPVTDLVGKSPWKRRHYEQIDGVKNDEN